MKKFILFVFVILSLTTFCGCMDEGETPPLSLERTNLIQRLFASLEKGDKAAAVAQTEKLQTMLPDNAYCAQVLETLTANTYIVHAQKAINDGHDALALEILDKGIRKHPMNRILINQYNQLKLICDIETSLKKGEFKAIPRNLYSIPVYGVRLVKKMQSKNIPIERKD